ncbi:MULTISPECIES: alcohol dehydrogenase catalytic domain-containing protein [Streptomyces]|uniref:alcohol dehydrogenase catalytic domain-containing protein n=1 Tax=Streptomyces lycopersici TaxID=2974589 RepID=UPI0035232F86
MKLTATCICGSDLWPYRGIEPADHQVMGHEYVGVVEEVGSAVRHVRPGDFVVGSFVISDNTCEICRAGFPSKCVHASSSRRRSAPRPKKARIPHAIGDERRHTRTTGPGGQPGATAASSAVGPTPAADSSDKSLPGPAETEPTPPHQTP